MPTSWWDAVISHPKSSSISKGAPIVPSDTGRCYAASSQSHQKGVQAHRLARRETKDQKQKTDHSLARTEHRAQGGNYQEVNRSDRESCGRDGGAASDGAGVHVLKEGTTTRYVGIRSEEDELARIWTLYPRHG
jgi:hypothetical protein